LLHREHPHSSALASVWAYLFRNSVSQNGNLPIEAAVIQFPPLPQDPNNEKEFLRYPKASPLTEKGSPGVSPQE
jgi:hypothetical protein